jgi:hypothetical protein
VWRLVHHPRSRRGSLAAIAIALAAAVLAPPAFAQHAPSARGSSSAQASPEKEKCVAAFDRGQRAQSDRALRRAQTELIVCSQETCPTVLRADCAGVLAEVRSALPTVVFAADDGNGHELTDVKVYVGTELVTPVLDGRAIAVDPGTFDLRFERPGHPPLVASRTIRDGEKNRVIRVSLGAPSGGIAPGPPHADETPLAGKRDAVGWLLPGSLALVGVAGLGVALVTRLGFDSRVEELRGSCAPECTQAQRSDLSGTVVTSNVALGVGIGAIVLGVVAWFVTAPATSSSSAGSSASRTSGVPRRLVPGGLAW